jgi:hypothetical protein
MATGNENVGWSVHFGRLSAATDGAVETARGLRRKVDEAKPACVAAATGHPEMEFAASLTACHGRFSDHFHGHADEIHGIGSRLAQNHTTYSLAEQRTGDATKYPAAGLPNQEI